MRLRRFPAESQSLYAWFLHVGMLDALFDDAARSRIVRRARQRIMSGNADAYTRELEKWLAVHPVQALDMAIATEQCHPGVLVWCELPFHWSEVASERRRVDQGETDLRSSFHSVIETSHGAAAVHGTFDPSRLTCSTANSELSGVRTQYMLAQVAGCLPGDIELRPVAIGARLLSEVGGWVDRLDRPGGGQRFAPDEVEQFRSVDFARAPRVEDLEVMRAIPEAEVKRTLAFVLGEPVVPKDWGGEQSDLWTARLRVAGRSYTAAFLLKGPAGGTLARPMTIGMLGKNGDQLQRLASTPAEVLVVQHCHEVKPEVVSMLRSLASDFRHVRHYMVLDGYDTFAILEQARP
ncbi:hypothetical protein LG324_03350 [Phycicoccus jejuensis]|uniref:hypothetical protein n=1 Tax=Phycicoccus jejuensis TaxID=367299 RepID=UPI0038503A3F